MAIGMNSGLIEYLEVARVVDARAKAEHAPALQRCAELDQLLATASEHAVAQAPPAASALNVHARLMFASAVRTALVGHVPPILAILRACLESACYAQEMVHRPELAAVWLDRHKSPAARKRCRDEFGGGLIRSVSTHVSAVVASGDRMILDYYDRLIDHGAHPNVASVMRGIEVEETDEHYFVRSPGVSFSMVEKCLYLCFEGGLYTALVMASRPPVPSELVSKHTELADKLIEWERQLDNGG